MINCPKMKNRKMFVFCVALVFTTGRGTDEQHFLTKTINVGEDATLTCSRPSSELGLLFWVKLAPGHLPEVVAASYTFDTGFINATPRVSARKEPGAFVLHIKKMELSDTAFYYCEKFDELKKIILNSTFLRVKGPEPNVTAIIEHVSSNPVRPGDSVTLQCSVLSDPDDRTCSEGPSVYWFRAGTNKSHPVLVYATENSKGECEPSSETQSSQKCVFSFSRHNVSSSDAGTYHCAVATCGRIVFGNGVNLDIDVNTYSLSEWLITVFALLAVSVSVTTVLICIRKRDTYRAVGSSDLCSQQDVEDASIYSAVTFTVTTKWWNKKQRKR
ncbi:signal-regulatory protein beta-2-like isoform X2 [Betta splendens]|uniref:Signal-regulatory protein beta-2-like isoform X2 n=1 Tax=Betta splendens TaxID=158456 RepID=A0A6P7NPE4_BETSP|nr:signal-regulatory protein beta-2-like isoform X2 [Betta splendens]XP_029021767.1 signal-regulatory protein beta-2-like isoform X2 [Betta splendens]